VVNREAGEIIEVNNNNSGYLYTIKEVAEGIIIKEENENNITTNSGIESEERFDPEINRLSESDFNKEVNRDKDINDKNI
jgi:hypothetical protein